MIRTIVDASVGVKWVIDEPGSDDAAVLLEGRELYADAFRALGDRRKGLPQARRQDPDSVQVFFDRIADLEGGPP